jgi:hypothetical protein
MRVFIRLTVLIAFMVGLSLTVGAEVFEYKEYEVQKGDTLWDISQKELKDPFNWPIVWRENSWIENPDRIYPGQIIRIPVSLLKQPETVPKAKPAPKVAKVKKKAPPPPPQEKGPEEVAIKVSTDIVEISADDIHRGGYISRVVPSAGEVIGSPGNRIVLGGGDEVYISGAESPRAGDKFYIVRNTGLVRHPDTREPMGYKIKILGILEVERVGIADITARVIKGYDSIGVGDLLDNYYEVDPVFLTGEPRKPEIEGFVVASTDMRLLNGMLDVVYIDKGKNDGLLPGDMIATLAPGTPDRANGVLRVVSTRDETSTLVVFASVYDVSINHDVASCAKVNGCVIK